MTKEYFTRKEALESIKEVLNDGFEDEYGELFDTVFNSDYYIVYTSDAKRALEQYGVFDAIERVKEYEEEIFGEVNTNFADASQVANMLWYIIGNNVVNDIDLISELWNELATKENNKKIIAIIDEMISYL